MIKNFKIELIVLGIVFLAVLLSHNIGLDFFSKKIYLDAFLNNFFVNITVLGNSIWYFGVSVFFIVFLLLTKNNNIFKKYKKISEQVFFANIFLFLSVLISGILTQAIKHLVGRARPNHIESNPDVLFNFLTANSDFHSFPSGHATTIFVVGLVFSFFLPRLRYLFIFLALVVAFSRVVVGAHFPTDIFAGIIVGIIGYKISIMILRKYYSENLSIDYKKIAHNIIILYLISSSVVMVFLTLGPSIDIYTSSLFYFGKNQFFLQSYYAFTIFFRQIIIPLILIYLLVLPVVGLIIPLNKIYFNYKFVKKDIYYLWFSVLFVLLVFVNFFLKNFWGRARPGDIIELDGEDFFTPWYRISENCLTNCSFVSGDASVGFSLISLYFITKNKLYCWASLVFGFSLGLVRIMEGGHFISDIIMAGFFAFIFYFIFYNIYLKKSND